jgi:ribosome-binding protein aMBF1 (putative translation factor)
MDHQNWETYIIHCKNGGQVNQKDKLKDQKQRKKPTSDNLRNTKLEKKIEEGNLKHQKINPELSKKIQQARLSKNMTQKQLANRLSIPVNEINEMECGRFIYNGQKISKVMRFLSIKK